MTDVRLTATNPVDSSVVPVACNEKGELKLEEPLINSDEFVAKTGDTMTGNLHLGDGITLNPDGSAQFAAGNLDVYNTGKVIYGGDKITLDGTNGSAVFAGDVSIGDKTYASAGYGGAYIAGNTLSGGGLFLYKSTESNAATDGASFLRLYSAANTSTTKTEKIGFRADGSASFAGVLSTDDRLVCNAGGVKAGTDTAFLMYQGDGSKAAVDIKANGSAEFAGDVIIGSRGQQWMIVESNGLAHLVAQVTRENEISTADLVNPAPSIDYPPLRDIPGELTMVEEQLQKVLEKLRMVPEAGWEVWDGSD